MVGSRGTGGAIGRASGPIRSVLSRSVECSARWGAGVDFPGAEAVTAAGSGPAQPFVLGLSSGPAGPFSVTRTAIAVSSLSRVVVEMLTELRGQYRGQIE